MRFNINGVIGEITSLPGCSQIAVSHSVFVPVKSRGTGLGKAAHSKRLKVIKDLGYDVAICTVDLSNIAQVKILQANGWKCAFMFNSSKTSNDVGIFVKKVSS